MIMTFALSYCAFFIVIRALESVIVMLLKLYKKYTYVSVEPTYKRLVANIAPELHEKIKRYVLSINMTITQYVFTAVVEKLKRDGVLQ
jgi:hypothetical protein